MSAIILPFPRRQPYEMPRRLWPQPDNRSPIMVARFLTIIVALLLSPTAFGAEPSYLDFGAGAFNAFDGNGSRPVPEIQGELRYGGKVLYLGPAVGIAANSRHGLILYGGLYSDLAFGPVIVTPFGGVAGYYEGEGKDLGGAFEFRLSLSVRYEMTNGDRVGLQFAHVSNAYTGRINPGDEELLLTWSLPFRF